MEDDFDYLFKRNIARMDFKSRIDHHKHHPEQSLKEYKKESDKQIEIEVTPMKKIYLDTYIWINMLKALQNHDKSSIYYDIFQILKIKVRAGILICPFSETLFTEVLKQSDLASRRATAQVADVLSANFCIKPFYYIVQCEVFNLNLFLKGQDGAIESYKWSKAIGLIGDLKLSSNETTPESLLLQKCIYDGTLLTSIQEIIADHDQFKHSNDISNWHTDFFNMVKKKQESSSVNNLDKILINELTSSFKSVAEFLNLGNLSISSDFIKCNMSAIKNYCSLLFTFSSIHAYLQRDKSRIIKINDFYDIIHSSLAIGTCDYLFTERSFAALIKTLKLDNLYNIGVHSNPNEILKIIDEI
ncbi:MAG: hypothetical protein EOO90_24320 [Pedobacter sp.]|nr:MAG: hypothetical protein EOO90_24320 [Pedobacter sp.]